MEEISGKYDVAVIDQIVLRDEARAKDVHIKGFFPVAEGNFPVIVFSHGAGAVNDEFGSLSYFLAGHGYICLHPAHADSLALQGLPSNTQTLRKVLADMLISPQDWENRARDVSFVIDALPQIAAKLPELKAKPDAERIGVSGHSYGAYTICLVAGTRIDLPDGTKNQSFADGRVKAALALSPQGRDQMGLNEHSWDMLTLPFMTITGTLDKGARGQDVSWRKDLFNFAPPGDKYHLLIKGANHFSYSSKLPKAGEPDVALDELSGAIVRYVRVAALAFWNAYLKDDGIARAYLLAKKLSEDSQNAVEIFVKY